MRSIQPHLITLLLALPERLPALIQHLTGQPAHSFRPAKAMDHHHLPALPFPPEIGYYYLARVTVHGGSAELATDIIQVVDQIGRDRADAERQFDDPPTFYPSPGGRPVWGIIGIYRERADASRALDLYRAWRDGS